MKQKIFFLFFLFLPLMASADDTVSRRLVAFWDSETDQVATESLIHKTVEMPLNHLGFDLVYSDIRNPLPDLSQCKDVSGVVLCFRDQTAMDDPMGFIDWAIQAIDRGKKVVILRNPGFFVDKTGEKTSVDQLNRLFEKLGFSTSEERVDYPFDYKVISRSGGLTEFERTLPFALPPFYLNRANNDWGHSFLTVGIPDMPETYSDLIIISSSGGYVSKDYAHNFEEEKNPREAGWYLDPFRFFSTIFSNEIFPIPDTTTLAGRRIFYTCCSSKGWNKKAQGQKISSSEVLLNEIIKQNPAVPISLGIIAADLDPKWNGSKKSRSLFKTYLKYPQIEVASNTYSYPLDWKFLVDEDPDEEIPYLYLYRTGKWKKSISNWFRSKKNVAFPSQRPRLYTNERFDLEKEIGGSIACINHYASSQNPVQLLLWPGENLSSDAPLAICEQLGIKNIGGRGSRFDAAFPSILYVTSIGKKLENGLQVYASTQSDESYIERKGVSFHGFYHLPQTLENTESPRRLKPIGLFFHSSSGQYPESVQAIKSNLAYIMTQSSIPIRTTQYCEIVEGFYSVAIERLGEAEWKIHNRKGLQTFRFDHLSNMALDFGRSVGVIGFVRREGSHYVYLDAAENEAIIKLKHQTVITDPYLLDSSWEIMQLKRKKNSFKFYARGWGPLSMRWQVPSSGTYKIQINPANGRTKSLKVKTEKKILQVEIDLPYDTLTQIKVFPTGDKAL